MLLPAVPCRLWLRAPRIFVKSGELPDFVLTKRLQHLREVRGCSRLVLARLVQRSQNLLESRAASGFVFAAECRSRLLEEFFVGLLLLIHFLFDPVGKVSAGSRNAGYDQKKEDRAGNQYLQQRVLVS